MPREHSFTVKVLADHKGQLAQTTVRAPSISAALPIAAQELAKKLRVKRPAPRAPRVAKRETAAKMEA